MTHSPSPIPSLTKCHAAFLVSRLILGSKLWVFWLGSYTNLSLPLPLFRCVVFWMFGMLLFKRDNRRGRGEGVFPAKPFELGTRPRWPFRLFLLGYLCLLGHLISKMVHRVEKFSFSFPFPLSLSWECKSLGLGKYMEQVWFRTLKH